MVARPGRAVLERQASYLVAEVVTGNDTKLTRVSSRIRLAFPPGLRRASCEPGSEPAAPKRPLPAVAVVSDRLEAALAVPRRRRRLDQLHDYAKLAALRVHDPAYARASNGELMVTYPSTDDPSPRAQSRRYAAPSSKPAPRASARSAGRFGLEPPEAAATARSR